MKIKGNEYFSYYIIIMLLTLSIGTALHDPFLHGLMAYLNGWSIESYSTSLFTGHTSSMAPKDASTFSIWLFFMFPSMFIITSTFIITYMALMSSTFEDRLVLTAGVVLVALNMPSLFPGVIGSDSDNAFRILIERGTPEIAAILIQYSIFIIFFLLWCYYIYVAIENNPKDAKKRLHSLIR